MNTHKDSYLVCFFVHTTAKIYQDSYSNPYIMVRASLPILLVCISCYCN